MNSKQTEEQAFVWIWLPGETLPVVAGKIKNHNDKMIFNYGQSYLNRQKNDLACISIYDKELPLKRGGLSPPNHLDMPGCIRDASPDAWGRRVILNQRANLTSTSADTSQLSEITYLLSSGSDRIGALDFQASATQYVSRETDQATLSMLLESAERVMAGTPLVEPLDAALLHGTSIGGARPKALIEHRNKKYIAKFSTQADLYSVVKSEFVAMRLAEKVGLNVAPVKFERVLGKDVLLIERFDRIKGASGWQRKLMLSALTLQGLTGMLARYASYESLAQIIRYQFSEPKATLKELYARLVYNILCGNTDDHARNHAAFWDGQQLSLTPAYDVCPQPRTGQVASQAMLIKDTNNHSQLTLCLQAANCFLLKETEARLIIEHQIQTINEHWQMVCEEAELNTTDRNWLWGRQFMNPFALEGF